MDYQWHSSVRVTVNDLKTTEILTNSCYLQPRTPLDSISLFVGLTSSLTSLLYFISLCTPTSIRRKWKDLTFSRSGFQEGRTHPIRGERQPHALQLASWLVEAEVVLLRLWDDEVELDLFPKQQMGECEGMKCWLVQLDYKIREESHHQLAHLCQRSHCVCFCCSPGIWGWSPGTDDTVHSGGMCCTLHI